jgi:UDP-glucuronate 4-epimerase
MKRMKILLTGSEGFIGSNFRAKYSDHYDFVSLDMLHNLFWSPQDIRTHVKDPSIDAVVHLAALAGVRRSHKIPEAYWEMNVDGSRNIFEQYDCPIVWASSSSIYEWWLSPYATTKKVCEEIAPDNALGLRFHTVYGDDSRPDMLYHKVLRHDVEYVTNHTRDWTHVYDVSDAIHICLTNWEKVRHNRAIDVGNGEPVSVKEMVDHLWKDNNLPFREVVGEREHTCANPTVLKELGWKPKHHILRDNHESV